MKTNVNFKTEEDYFTGYANQDFFEKITRFTFKLKGGKSPSEGLMKFLEGPTVADCGNATVACYYKVILDLVGEKKFNEFFGVNDNKIFITQKGIVDPNSPISYFSHFTKLSKMGATGVMCKRPLYLGDECHFAGVEWYAHKHPTGFGGSWNVIYVGNNEQGQQLFLAHGFEKALTEIEINEMLIELYNRERTPEDLQFIQTSKAPHLYDQNTNYYLQKYYKVSTNIDVSILVIKGFLAGSGKSLNLKKILKMINSKDVGNLRSFPKRFNNELLSISKI